jgi:xanthine/uracil permease
VFFWKNNLIVSAVVLASIILLLYFKNHKKEYVLVLIGFLSGVIIEFIATNIDFETYANPTLYGVPLFMPLIWAYVFQVSWRIGNEIIGCPK